tara:strand:+ start:88 stop:582 length:495 start_codon:yes stop_codon:yes gene_type:complete
MDNIQNWIYLILGAIYFLSKLRKKNKVATAETQDKESTRSKKIKTFEELLGEFTGFNKLDSTEDVDIKDLSDEKKPDIDRPNLASEKVPVPNSLSENEITTLDKDVPLQNTLSSEIKDFKDNIIEENTRIKVRKNSANEIKNELKTTKGIKRAIIFSELFKRKY